MLPGAKRAILWAVVSSPSPPSRISGITPKSSKRRSGTWRVAGAVVVAGLLGVMYPAVAPPMHPALPMGQPVLTDAQMFALVVERVRAGEDYYSAMGAELRQHGYPTRDPFNWRTPLHLSALALAPWAVWRALLTALLVALYVGVMITVRSGPAALASNGLMLGVLVVTAAPDAIFVSEAWAGVLLALSVCAYALDRSSVAIVLALTALVVRELAAPYCVVCALLAVSDRRWRQCAAWAAGAAIYSGYYSWHVAQVLAHRAADDIAHGTGWLTLPGVPFLQAALLKLGWFALLPSSMAALATALLAAGLVAPGTPRRLRAASAAFAGLFLVAGFPFNDYWGFIAAPVWAITCGYGVGAIIDTVSGLSASSSAPA
jgi:hypothetical protein